MIGGVEYLKIDDEGLHLIINNEPQILDVDTVIICAGQDSERRLYHELQNNGQQPHLIGGAREATELDAKTAIKQGTELAIEI